jgi:hypothetical protein
MKISEVFFSFLYLLTGNKQEACRFSRAPKSIFILLGLCVSKISLFFNCLWDNDLIVNYNRLLLTSFIGIIEK